MATPAPSGPVLRQVIVGEEREVRQGKNASMQVVTHPADIDVSKLVLIQEQEPFLDSSSRIQVILVGGITVSLQMTRSELRALIPPGWLP